MADLLWKPFHLDNIISPYPMYARLRSTDPIHRSQTGEFIVTKYADVKEVLKSASFATGNRLEWLKRGIQYFHNKEEDLRAIYQAMNAFILMLNEPQHMHIRGFISKTWSHRDVDTIIGNNIERLLKSLESKTEIDVVAEYAQPLPVLTIAQILGIPTDDYLYLKELGVAMTKALDLYVSFKDLVQINDASKKFIFFFQEQIRLKNQKRDTGLLSQLIEKNKFESPRLTEEQLISIAIFLFIAGEETSASLISTGLYALLMHPDQATLLQHNASKIESAVEEILRYDSVVQLLGRIAREDYLLRGTLVPAGATVTLVIGSANHDEEFFKTPDVFDITRYPNRHLSFGTGVHFCLGDWLGRRQAQLALRALLERFPALSLAPQQQPVYYNNLAIRALKQLNVKLF